MIPNTQRMVRIWFKKKGSMFYQFWVMGLFLSVAASLSREQDIHCFPKGLHNSRTMYSWKRLTTRCLSLPRVSRSVWTTRRLGGQCQSAPEVDATGRYLEKKTKKKTPKWFSFVSLNTKTTRHNKTSHHVASKAVGGSSPCADKDFGGETERMSTCVRWSRVKACLFR